MRNTKQGSSKFSVQKRSIFSIAIGLGVLSLCATDLPLAAGETVPAQEEIVPARLIREANARKTERLKNARDLNGKVRGRLLDAWKGYRAEGLDGARRRLTQAGQFTAKGEIVAVVSLDGDANRPVIRAGLARAGATILLAGEGHLKIALPLDQLEAVAAIPGVQGIRAVYPPRGKNVVKSEGLGLTRASLWQAAGLKGAGVKVAVVDSAFASIAELQAADELPASLKTHNLSGTAMNAGTDAHGSACAEIIYDLAPEAEIHLIKIDDPTDLIAAKNYCLTNGVTIISCSLGWDALNFHDGVAYENAYTTIANHPVTAVNQATAAGILWVNAAGNEQYRQTLIAWRDTNNDEAWDLNTQRANLNILRKDGSASIPAGTEISVYLTWNRWPLASEDLDLSLYRNVGGGWSEVASSDATQDGSADSFPQEDFTYVTTSASAQYAVVIWRYGAVLTQPWALVRYHGVDQPTYFDYNNSVFLETGSLGIPADAASALTVGAVDFNYFETGPLEGWSSHGPNNAAFMGGEPLIKPDLVGPDGIQTTSFPEGIRGTSGAAAHVAALAALVKGANPAYTATQIRETLQTNAIDIYGDGRDNYFGYGAARLPSVAAKTELFIRYEGGEATITWVGTSVLQTSPSMTTQFQDVQGNPPSPYKIQPSDQPQFFRLRD